MKQSKNIKKKILAISAFALTFASCSKKLDLNPTDSIILQNGFESVSDAYNWDLGIYSTLRGNLYGEFMLTQDIQGDQLNATLNYGNNYGGTHTWTWTSADYYIEDVWSGYYNGIVNANLMIGNFKNIPTTSTNDVNDLKEYTGDAYFIRAYYYSQLVLRFAKAYNSSTASTDLGVPLVTVYDYDQLESNWPARSSISEVYTQINNDLDSASSLLSDVDGSAGSKFFTIDAVRALKARVALYTEDWATAKTNADLVINSGNYQLNTTATGMKNMWLNDDGGESIVQLNASNPKEVPNVNDLYLFYTSAKAFYVPYYVPTQWMLDLYPAGDLRKNAYFAKLPIGITGATATDSLFLVNKYAGNPSLWTTTVTNYEQAPKLIRVAESYLISAESAYEAGNSSAALTTLNSLRVARGLQSITTSGAALLDSIKTERTRELAFEGFRIDDLKRWHLPLNRHDPQNLNFIMTSGSGFYNFQAPADDNLFVWGIPINDMTVNTKLVQNPGW